MSDEFKFPKWKKVVGDRYTMSNGNLQYDLLDLEEYMNEMIALGWRLVEVSWGTRFTFVPCEPGEYICHTILTATKNGFFDKKKAARLVDQLTEGGAEIILQKNTMRSQNGLIAMRPAAAGPFEDMKDLDARIAECAARKKFYETTAVTWLAIGLAMLVLGITAEYLRTFFVISVVWFVLAFYYYRPVPRYKEIIKRLKAERDNKA